MNVSVRQFDPGQHYEAVCSWWKAEQWPGVPLDHLPELGFVSYVDEQPAAAGWIYRTDSAFCLFEFVVANPDVRGEPRGLALAALTEEAIKAALAFDFKTIFTSVSNPSLICRLEAKGFSQADRGMTNLICQVRR